MIEISVRGVLESFSKVHKLVLHPLGDIFRGRYVVIIAQVVNHTRAVDKAYHLRRTLYVGTVAYCVSSHGGGVISACPVATLKVVEASGVKARRPVNHIVAVEGVESFKGFDYRHTRLLTVLGDGCSLKLGPLGGNKLLILLLLDSNGVGNDIQRLYNTAACRNSKNEGIILFHLNGNLAVNVGGDFPTVHLPAHSYGAVVRNTDGITLIGKAVGCAVYNAVESVISVICYKLNVVALINIEELLSCSRIFENTKVEVTAEIILAVVLSFGYVACLIEALVAVLGYAVLNSRASGLVALAVGSNGYCPDLLSHVLSCKAVGTENVIILALAGYCGNSLHLVLGYGVGGDRSRRVVHKELHRNFRPFRYRGYGNGVIEVKIRSVRNVLADNLRYKLVGDS